MKSVRRYDNCFVCGFENDIGLKMDFFDDDGIARAEYVPTSEFEGYKNVFHGGIISTLLDEVMIKAILAKDILTVTYNLDITFKKPVYIGDKIRLEGRIVSDRGVLIETEGTVFKENNEIAAIAKGKYYKVDGEMKKKLAESLE